MNHLRYAPVSGGVEYCSNSGNSARRPIPPWKISAGDLLSRYSTNVETASSKLLQTVTTRAVFLVWAETVWILLGFKHTNSNVRPSGCASSNLKKCKGGRPFPGCYLFCLFPPPEQAFLRSFVIP